MVTCIIQFVNDIFGFDVSMGNFMCVAVINRSEKLNHNLLCFIFREWRIFLSSEFVK